mmetsp:Transcript_4544/g.9268  ORF Transcript_4544/g.9268 Transcript_4544/m.9268 type:complete len:83 (+) Transcript_4544:673-921(+)
MEFVFSFGKREDECLLLLNLQYPMQDGKDDAQLPSITYIGLVMPTESGMNERRQNASIDIMYKCTKEDYATTIIYTMIELNF